jgi:tetratricopeptide (TPR) repeat protein
MLVAVMLGLVGSLLQSQPVAPADLLRQAEEKIQAEQLDLAEALLQQAVRQAPADLQTLYRLGYVQYRRRELAPARASFAAVVKLAPPADNSRYFLGRIALLENKPKEAIQWLEPVVASNGTNFDAASQLAKAYAAAGEPGKAVQSLKTAVNQAPWDGALYYRLGRLYKQTGENELAEDAFDTSARLHSATSEDVQTLMRTSELLREAKPVEALQLSQRILERVGAAPVSLVALGVLLVQSKLPSEALKAFEQAAALDANLFQAHFNYGLALLNLDRARDALAPLRRAFTLLPQSQEAGVTLGLAAVMNQQYAEALAPLELAWKRDHSNTRLGALVATVYLRTGAPAKAVPVLRALPRRKDDPTVHFLLIEALDASGASEQAMQVASELQQQFPSLAQAHMAAAQELVKAGKYQQAGAAFQKALELDPGRREAELGLADSLQKSGRHEAALEHYRAAGAGLPARLGEARSLIALRQLEQARKVLEDALPEYPSDASLRLELSRVYARLGEPERAAEQARMVEQLRAR